MDNFFTKNIFFIAYTCVYEKYSVPLHSISKETKHITHIFKTQSV